MTNHDAAKLLELPVDATPEQLEGRFHELRTKLEDKIAKAPTPGLKAKYRESLDEITTAFETLTLATDSSSLPVAQKQGTGSKEQGGGPAPARLQGTALHFDNPKSKIQNQKSGKEFAVVAILAVVLLAGGGWFIMKTRAENAEQARLAAEAKAEAERVAADAARRAREEKARQEKLLADLRGRVAELNVSYEAALATEPAAEREFNELRARQRDVAARGNALEQRVLAGQAQAQSAYLDWLRATLPAHPASVARAKATELLAAGASDQAAPATETYAREMNRLREDVAQRTPDLAAIEARVRGEPILAQWRKILDEEKRKDQEVAHTLPAGATPLNADRDLAALIIAKFGVNPQGIPADFPAAMAWLERAAGQTDFRAMLQLADMYNASNRVPADEEKMWLWRNQAAEAGDAATKYAVATKSIMQMLAVDPGSRIRWLRQAAEAGHLESQLELGRSGGWVAPEPFFSGTEAEVRQAAAAGKFFAQMELRQAEVAGQLLVSHEEALQWLQKAAAQGSKEALHQLGVQYATGNGIEQDWTKAVGFFRQNADQPASQFYLGEAHAKGLGVEQDDREAFRWYRQAAAGEVVDAFAPVADFLASGRGVEKDEKAAIEWYRRAAKYGIP